MSEPTLYLFDGYNLLNAVAVTDARALRDELASFVALRGARGVLVFDGAGTDESHGPLEVVYAANADAVLERLAAEHRESEHVFLVSSDAARRRSLVSFGPRAITSRAARGSVTPRSGNGGQLTERPRRELVEAFRCL